MSEEIQNVPEEKIVSNEIKSEENAAETEDQVNWRKFREQRALERRQLEEEKRQKQEAQSLAKKKEEEARALKEAVEALLAKNNETISYSDDSEEDIIQKRIAAALEAERKKNEEEMRRREQAEYPTKLVQNHPDFHQVCSSDNLDYLEYHYPEVARAFRNSPDSYDKWSDVYKAVKRFVPNPQTAQVEKTIQKNATKPQSMNVGGSTRTGDDAPHVLTEQMRKDNWARMQRIMKGS